MSGIQIVLLTGIAFLAIYFIVRIKKRLVDIIFMAVTILVAIVFVVRPETTNIIAHKLGVGRGADLVFYVSILLFWFVVVKLYLRVRKMEQLFTDIIRKDAIDKAENFAGKENDDSQSDASKNL